MSRTQTNRRPRHRALSVLFAVGAVLVPTASALAQTSEPAPEVRAQAESIANQAFEEYRQGNYEAAIESYERALQLASSGALLFNIARIYDTRLSDPKQAETYYQRCVDNPGTEPDLVRRANERLQALRDARKSAAEPTTEPRSERVDQPAAAGTNKTETLPRTVRPSQAPAVQATRLDDTTTGSGLTTAGLVVGSIGLVGMGVGGYFGLSAASKNNDAGDMCPNDVCADPKGVDLTEDARSAARLSTGFMVGGGALVASGIALLIAGSGASRERPESHALRLTPAIGDGSAGMFMKGAW